MTVSSDLGSIIVRALITDRQKAGQLFVPMHWTDQYAANARVDTLVQPVVDSFSGQPALKSSVVNASLFKPTFYGFLVSAQKPNFINEAYWALAKCEGGWRAEFVLSANEVDLRNLGHRLFANVSDLIPQTYSDMQQGDMRAVWFDNDWLMAAMYLSKVPVEVSRSFITECLLQDYDDTHHRNQVLAGRNSAMMPDKGAIICSCFNVGANEIAESGCVTVNDVGSVLKAGTNCGSCRAEIRSLLQRVTAIAAE